MATEKERMHLVARLEHLFNKAIERLTDGTVLAYYGLNGSQQPAGRCEMVLVGSSRWKVVWRNTGNISHENPDCLVCPHQTADGAKQDNLGAPFWRGSGDDIAIQHMIEKCCPSRPDSRLKIDELGRISFNSFRAVIFQCDNDNATDHSFMLAPVIAHEGDELGKRIRMTTHLIRFLHETVGLQEVRVCVLREARQSSRNYSRTADNLTRQAEILLTNVQNTLRKSHFDGTVVFAEKSDDIDFEIERAMVWADLIVPFDGSTGNLLARILSNVSGKSKLYAIPWFKEEGGRIRPIGEDAFIGYAWPNPELPIQRAVMWKVLGEQQP